MQVRERLIYSTLLLAQLLGSSFLVWKALPAFKELVLTPGKQLASTPFDNNTVVGVLLAMQGAYWYRFLRISIPFHGSSTILNHLFLFLGRLNFIFGSALFSIVIFRHIPELGPDADASLLLHRGALLTMSLFALFCLTLELERLGTVLGNQRT
jgi:hypothetical protein